MIVWIIFCLLTCPVLILIDEYKHDDADDGESHHGHRHRNPEKRICPFTVIGSHRQIIIVEVGKRIPKEPYQTHHHKNDEERSIYFIFRATLFIPRTLCYGYKV